MTCEGKLLPRLLRVGVMVVGILATAFVAVTIIADRRNEIEHEHRVQSAYDTGRIERAQWQNATPDWRRGWDWQMATSVDGTGFSCGMKVSGGASATEEDVDTFMKSAVGHGCNSAQLSQLVFRPLSADEKTAYLLGFNGLPR